MLVNRKIATLATLFVAFAFLTSAVSYELSFRGIELDENNLNAGDTVNVTTNLVNLGEEPRTDNSVTVSLTKESDNTVFFKEEIRNDIDLAPREIEKITENIQIPERAPSGTYNILLQSGTPTGVPTTFIEEEINVENDRTVKNVQLGRQGVYLMTQRIINTNETVRTFELPSYGNQGENILPGTDFGIHFKLSNTGNERIDPEAEFSIIPTYSDDKQPIDSFTRDLEAIEVGESNSYNFSRSMTEPGTYNLETVIRDSDGNQLSSADVRVVISGEGGSIVDVGNHNDTYSQGQEMSVDTMIVGPADGSSVVNNAYLSMEVSQDGETLIQERETIDQLPYTPEERTLESEVPEDLDDYTVRIVLGKGDAVYDTFEADYQELDPERLLTESGEVWDENQCFDDGECTEREYELGDCYDCFGVSGSKFNDSDDQTEETGSILDQEYIYILLIIIGISAIVVYWRWNNEK